MGALGTPDTHGHRLLTARHGVEGHCTRRAVIAGFATASLDAGSDFWTARRVRIADLAANGCAFDDDCNVPVRVPLDASSDIVPSNPMRRSRKSALSAPLYWR